jgi:hypothetical protein
MSGDAAEGGRLGSLCGSYCGHLFPGKRTGRNRRPSEGD